MARVGCPMIGIACDKADRTMASDAAQHPGDYLKAGGNEVTDLVRRYPIPALLVGIGIGFMLAKAIRA